MYISYISLLAQKLGSMSMQSEISEVEATKVLINIKTARCCGKFRGLDRI